MTNQSESECFFITESKWMAFAEELAGGPVICVDGVAMYDSLIIQRRTNAVALSALCMHMCIMVHAGNVWLDFIKENGLSSHVDENRHDLPANDWKPS